MSTMITYNSFYPSFFHNLFPSHKKVMMKSPYKNKNLFTVQNAWEAKKSPQNPLPDNYTFSTKQIIINEEEEEKFRVSIIGLKNILDKEVPLGR
jgi:hypothetical protein